MLTDLELPFASQEMKAADISIDAASQVDIKGSIKLKEMLEQTIDITDFHAHVYYDPATRETAERVRQGLSDRFAVQLGRWHDTLVGPHPKAMYQVSFARDQFDRVVPWLMLNREGLEILVHPNTGDAVADHTAHALWLGEKLAINLEPLRGRL